EQRAVKAIGEMSATGQSTREPTTGEKSAEQPTLVQQAGEDSEAGVDEGERSEGEDSTDSDVVEVPPGPRRSGRLRKAPERLSYHACLPPAALTPLHDDAKADVDLPKLEDVHADPEHRWDIATMTVKEVLASWKGKAVKAAIDEGICSLIANGTWELVYGADYNKTYAPVGSYVTLRIFLSIVAVLDLKLMQLDMKNAFLQSKLDRVLYIYHPDYYDDGTSRTYVDKLHWLFIDEEHGGRIPKTPVSVDAYGELTFDNEEAQSRED
ncbi:unnamed protein product, partial [Closterium sp. NIES-53]